MDETKGSNRRRTNTISVALHQWLRNKMAAGVLSTADVPRWLANKMAVVLSTANEPLKVDIRPATRKEEWQHCRENKTISHFNICINSAQMINTKQQQPVDKHVLFRHQTRAHCSQQTQLKPRGCTHQPRPPAAAENSEETKRLTDARARLI